MTRRVLKYTAFRYIEPPEINTFSDNDPDDEDADGFVDNLVNSGLAHHFNWCTLLKKRRKMTKITFRAIQTPGPQSMNHKTGRQGKKEAGALTPKVKNLHIRKCE